MKRAPQPEVCIVGGFSCGALAIGRYIAVGDHARAMIAIGDTEAVGAVYQHITGTYPAVDLTYVNAWLDANVPWYFGWAKAIFQFFLG